MYQCCLASAAARLGKREERAALAVSHGRWWKGPCLQTQAPRRGRGCVAQRVRKDNFMLHYDQLEVRVQLPMQHHLQHGGDAIAGVPHGLPR